MRQISALVLAAAALVLAIAPARAAGPCRDIEEASVSYTLCEFDTHRDALRLFWRDGGGGVFGGFPALEAALAARGEKLIFAMNAGMYDENRAPVGLYVEGGETLHPANTHGGAGNFHMKPNGVFWIAGQRAGVTETGRFLASHIRADYATQSGPMLVVGGRINPRIHDSGTSEKIRNGVGVADGHLVRFVISNQPVTFHAFAHLFRERLKCPDALFLDGSISALHAPGLGRSDLFRPMGPIVGATHSAR